MPCRRHTTFIIDPPFLFTLGSLIAFVGRRRLVSTKPNPFGPGAGLAVGYALLFWASVSWFGMNAADWMLSYMIPAETLPMGIVQAVFGLALVVAAISGHTVTAVLLQRGQGLAAASILCSGVLLWCGLWAITLDRYMVVGTYAEFIAGQAIPLQESSIIGAMNAAGAVQGLVGFGMLAWLYTSSKRLRAR